MSGHNVTIGSCGHTIARCRCIGPHTPVHVSQVCSVCSSSSAVVPITSTAMRPTMSVPFHPSLEKKTALVPPGRTPHRCPVCEGRGRVARDFYGETANASNLIICQSCHGTGVLWS